jgi:tRNA pseudouridine55 synthase
LLIFKIRGYKLINGIIVINKDRGYSSHQTLQAVRKLFFKHKAGHSGTLDPLAEGVLPVCMGKATRLTELIVELPKQYLADITLGRVTDTGDAEGNLITEKPVPLLDNKQLATLEKTFLGRQQQYPPLYSAVKYKGRPLYRWTREGKDVPRKSRTIEIYKIKIEKYRADYEPQLTIKIECSRGTYVRSLAVDIGNLIGCGAYLSALIRTAVGPYNIESSFTLDQLKQLEKEGQLMTAVQPMDSALQHLPYIVLTGEELEKLKNGQVIEIVPDKQQPCFVDGILYRLYDQEGSFMALGHIMKQENTNVLKTAKFLLTN